MRHAKRYLVATIVATLVLLAAGADAKQAAYTHGFMPNPTSWPLAEPGMAIDGGGTVWVGSIRSGMPPSPTDPTNTALPSTGFWRSTDGGHSFDFRRDPFQFSPGDQPGVQVGGSDADVASAQVPNADGHYNLYVATLGPPGGNNIAFSQDGGETWIVQPMGGILAGPPDRPWVAADGECTVYLAYHSGIPWWVNRYDLCAPTDNGLQPITGVQVDGGEIDQVDALVGKLTVDTSPTSPHQHNVYVPMEVCVEPLFPPSLGETAGPCGGAPRIAVSVSSDGGRSFTRHDIAPVPNRARPIWPTTVATDADGTVYVAWFDNHDAFLATSRDGGVTWTQPQQVNPLGTTAVYPTVAATRSGEVAVAWYGTTRDGDANDAAVMGAANNPASAEWRVWLAESRDGAAKLREGRAVTDPVHFGQLCTRGGGCGNANVTRTLLDDFAAQYTQDGRLIVAYTTDQPGGTRATSHIAHLTETARPGRR